MLNLHDYKKLQNTSGFGYMSIEKGLYDEALHVLFYSCLDHTLYLFYFRLSFDHIQIHFYQCMAYTIRTVRHPKLPIQNACS